MKRSTSIKILEKTYSIINKDQRKFICPTIQRQIPTKYDAKKTVKSLLNVNQNISRPWYELNKEGQQKRLEYLKTRLTAISKQPLTTAQKIACLLQVKINLKLTDTSFICPNLREILEKNKFISNLITVKYFEIFKIIPELLEFKPKKYNFYDPWFPTYDFKSRHKIINKTILKIIKNKVNF